MTSSNVYIFDVLKIKKYVNSTKNNSSNQNQIDFKSFIKGEGKCYARISWTTPEIVMVRTVFKLDHS